jgi:hypothetical protein
MASLVQGMPAPQRAISGAALPFERVPDLCVLPSGPLLADMGSGVLKGSKGELVSVTRAAAGLVEKPDGTFALVASGQPRVGRYGLFIEPGATNLCRQSQSFASPWVPSADGTVPLVTANQALAPDGTTTAALIEYRTAVPPGGWSDIRQSIPAGPGTYTFSVWLKHGTLNFVDINVSSDAGDHANTGVGMFFDEWQRYSITLTASAGTTALSFRIGDDGNGPIALGTGTVYAWGAQVEPGDEARTYLPTTSASAAIRSCRIKPRWLPPCLPLVRGHLSLVLTPVWSVPSGFMYVVSTVASGTARGVYIAINSNRTLEAAIFNNGSAVANPFSLSLTWTATQQYAIDLFWGPGGVKLFRDGVLVASASAAAPDGHAATMGLGTSAAGSGNYLNGWLNKLVVRRLP